MKYGKFTNKEGHEQNTCDIIADSMQLLGGKPSGESASAPRQAPKQAPRAASGFDDMDDDLIPF